MAEPTHQEPEGDVADANALVPDKLGFMCGIEVHQQLATGKLHSRQPGTLFDVTIDTIPDDWPKFEENCVQRVAKEGESTLPLGLK